REDAPAGQPTLLRSARSRAPSSASAAGLPPPASGERRSATGGRGRVRPGGRTAVWPYAAGRPRRWLARAPLGFGPARPAWPRSVTRASLTYPAAFAKDRAALRKRAIHPRREPPDRHALPSELLADRPARKPAERGSGRAGR